MTENPTPRQMVDELLRGVPPPRPLFLPIVFSLGAKLENLPLSTFLGNATKISNSLRQIRSHLRTDGVASYFDPYLEVEALGAALTWGAEDQRPTVRWPDHAAKGELPHRLRSPEDAAKRSRVSVAIEVIRRLKSLLRDGSLITASVTGPFTLAARITQLESEDPLRCEDLPDAALDVATCLMAQMSAAFVEAGADLIFIQEEVLPHLTAESCEAWSLRLAPTLNIIRFYHALPVLHLTSSRAFTESGAAIMQQHWDCVVCPTLDVGLPLTTRTSQSKENVLGVSLPPDALLPDQASEDDFDEFLRRALSELRPAILTTAGDLPAGTDTNRLIRVSKLVNG